MTAPTRGERADLDRYLLLLAKVGDGLTADNFRERVIQRAIRWERAARITLYGFGLGFMLAIAYQFLSPESFGRFGWILVWTLSLGGLGAVAQILLNILKLTPQEVSQSEEPEVVARIFLGCLFSLVLSLALIPEPLSDFHGLVTSEGAASAGDAARRVNVLIILPFLCGYSIRLVLGILTKAIVAVEMTLGLTELRPAKKGRSRRSSLSS